MQTLAITAATTIAYWLICGVFAVPILYICWSYRTSLKQKEQRIKKELGHERYQKAYANLRQQQGANYDPIRPYVQWRLYVVPVALLTGVVLCGAAMTLARLGVPVEASWTALESYVAHISLAAAYGFLGAYFSVLYDLVRRARTINLSVSGLHENWIKIAIVATLAPTLAPLMAGSLKPPYGDLAVAFALGAVPLRRLWAEIRKRAQPVLPDPERTESDTLYLVNGYRDGLRESLLDEGIGSVLQLAFSDPFALLLNTNLGWRVILDLIDQALLINYVGEKVCLTRPVGVRCAVDMATIYGRLLSPKDTERNTASALVGRLAEILSQPKEAVQNLAYQLYVDPAVQFIWINWSSDDTETAKAVPEPNSDDALTRTKVPTRV